MVPASYKYEDRERRMPPHVMYVYMCNCMYRHRMFLVRSSVRHAALFPSRARFGISTRAREHDVYANANRTFTHFVFRGSDADPRSLEIVDPHRTAAGVR
jgi:hypothetical protein